MKKVVYLLGAGAIKGEMSHQGIEADITMKGIGNNVLELSGQGNGEYWKIHENFGLPEDQDIEMMMSLLEGFDEIEASGFREVCEELRKLFRYYLITQITEKQVEPKIHSSLLHIHENYNDKMGETGERISGILTINYDSVIDEAFYTVYKAINYGYEFESNTYQGNENLPPLLKLHGSFNWKISGDKLIVSRDFEDKEYKDDFSGWIPPSVFKKPPGKVFPKIWQKAAKLVTNCDVLRVIGCSLRNEDFALLSLLFTSQLKSEKPFGIELIVPDEVAVGREEGFGKEEPIKGIMQRLPFLGRVRNFSALSVYREESFIADNIFLSWMLMKVREIELNKRESLDDDLINETLLLGV